MTQPNHREPADVVIIGAGPAGVSAAVQLAEAGESCLLLDEHPKIGGVIYRGPLRQGDAKHLDAKTRTKTADLIAAYNRHAERIRFLPNTQVLGPIDGFNNLALLCGNQFTTLTYRDLIIASGCYERATPFPGWTLPGVMSVGGIQLQLKSGLVKPGGRIALVGTGPLLLVAAKQCHMAGMTVAGVFEAGRRRDLLKHPPALLRNVPLLREGLAYHTFLKKAGIPLRHGWGVVSAHGGTELEQVTVAPYDRDWRPVDDKKQELAVDCLGVGYGFVSRTQLAQLLELEHENDTRDGVVPVMDAWGRSSKNHIYLAGDNTGVNGADAAVAAGRTSAIALLLDRGLLSKDKAERDAAPYRRALDAYRRFRAGFDDFSRIRPGLQNLPDAETVVCRCENITRGQLDQALDRGVNDLTTLKMVTRIGMGDCQGKMCAPFCHDYLKQRTGVDDAGVLRPRFPLAPLPFGAIVPEEEPV